MQSATAAEPSAAVQNRITYGTLAPEYDDPSHATVRDFQRLTKCLLERRSEEVRASLAPAAGGRWLIAGVGTGAHVSHLLALAGSRPASIDALDIAPEMISRAARSGIPFDRLLIGDVASWTAGERSYDVVVALLADPFLDEGGMAALGRLLSPEGRLAVTVPAGSWARRARRGMHPEQAWFTLKDGRRCWAPSYCWDSPDLEHLGASAGLRAAITAHARSDDLRIESAIIRDAASEVEPAPLEVLSLAIFRRDKS
jgi:SAM-dependent methyltransferase